MAIPVVCIRTMLLRAISELGDRQCPHEERSAGGNAGFEKLTRAGQLVNRGM